MEVTQLWRYPVKSMIGETVEGVALDEFGAVGDRTWAARDLKRGGIRGAKKIPALMKLSARDLDDGEVEISFPDGSSVRTAHARVDELVSEALGHPVQLERLRPASDLDHYRRGAPDSDDVMTELRTVFGRVGDESLPDFRVFPRELNSLLRDFESPPGTYYDALPLMVMSEQALTAMESALPDSSIDVRRFRPSIVIDAGDAPVGTTGHPEFEWAGRTARIGSAVIEFAMACPRCVMVTQEVSDSIPKDRAVLRHIVRDLGQNVGIYATVTTPGAIAVGDQVEFV